MIYPTSSQISLFLLSFLATFSLLVFLLRKTSIFGRTLQEYFLPTWFYFLGAFLGVIWQYLGINSLGGIDRGQAGQAIWIAMIALSVVTLVYKAQFNLKNIFTLGVIYALFVHGAKVSLRYFVYGALIPFPYRTLEYLGGRFIYGSVLAISAALLTGFALNFALEFSKPEKNFKKIALFFLGAILTFVFITVLAKIYVQFFREV